MYVDDYRAFPFYSARGPIADTRWFQCLTPYHRLEWTNRAYHCPAYQGLIWDSAPTAGSYSYNRFGAAPDNALVNLGLGGFGDVVPAVREGQVRVPSDMFAVMDAVDHLEGFPNQTTAWAGNDFAECTRAVLVGLLYYRQKPPQHGNTFNVSFCDAHVSPVKFTDLFNPPNTAQYWNHDHEPHPEFWQTGP
jgi:prepilin-type processing-associated H-X9-DG protein